MSSSIELEKKEDNVYKASMTQLPKEDLSFTLFASKQITLIDMVRGNIKYKIVFYALFTLVIIIILIILRSIQKLRKGQVFNL